MRPRPLHIETESEYFHRLDQELIEKMREVAAFEARRERLAEESPINEPTVLEHLERLGYDDSTVKLLFLVPMLQVAWVDGSVSQAERDRILAIANLRAVKADTPAWQRLLAWLARPPSNEFFQGNLGVIELIFRSLPENERKVCREALLLCCREVAIASCGVFGWKTRICADERRAIEEISRHLGPDESR